MLRALSFLSAVALTALTGAAIVLAAGFDPGRFQQAMSCRGDLACLEAIDRRHAANKPNMAAELAELRAVGRVADLIGSLGAAYNKRSDALEAQHQRRGQ